MLNFQKVKEDFEQEFYDMLKLEVLYFDDDRNVAHAFEIHMKNYIELFWSKYVPEYIVSLNGSIISCKIVFDADTNLIPFGFEFSADLSLIRQQARTWI